MFIPRILLNGNLYVPLWADSDDGRRRDDRVRTRPTRTRGVFGFLTRFSGLGLRAVAGETFAALRDREVRGRHGLGRGAVA